MSEDYLKNTSSHLNLNQVTEDEVDDSIYGRIVDPNSRSIEENQNQTLQDFDSSQV